MSNAQSGKAPTEGSSGNQRSYFIYVPDDISQADQDAGAVRTRSYFRLGARVDPNDATNGIPPEVEQTGECADGGRRDEYRDRTGVRIYSEGELSTECASEYKIVRDPDGKVLSVKRTTNEGGRNLTARVASTAKLNITDGKTVDVSTAAKATMSTALAIDTFIGGKISLSAALSVAFSANPFEMELSRQRVNIATPTITYTSAEEANLVGISDIEIYIADLNEAEELVLKRAREAALVIIGLITVVYGVIGVSGTINVEDSKWLVDGHKEMMDAVLITYSLLWAAFVVIGLITVKVAVDTDAIKESQIPGIFIVEDEITSKHTILIRATPNNYIQLDEKGITANCQGLKLTTLSEATIRSAERMVIQSYQQVHIKAPKLIESAQREVQPPMPLGPPPKPKPAPSGP